MSITAHRFDSSARCAVRGTIWVEGYRYDRAAPNRDKEPMRAHHQPIGRVTRIWQLVESEYTPIDWHLDFKSGYRWSESCWYRRIRYSHLPGVDVKVPWELARMQHLVQFAWAYGLAAAGEPDFASPDRYMSEFRNQILDFIATNPPRFGVNWNCTMDVAIRAANWLIAYDLFRAGGAVFDEAFEAELRRSVYQHGQHIVANLEWQRDWRSNHYLGTFGRFVAAYCRAA
jgi:hypothetical protein